MLSISHYIEDRFIEKQLSGLFVASFQKLSLFLPQRSRYAAIASTSQQVWIIGEPDITPPFIADNVYFFRPADAECRDYWIVLSDDPRFRIALFARECRKTEALSSAQIKGQRRQFEGFWTYRDEYINAIRASLEAHYALFRNFAFCRRPILSVFRDKATVCRGHYLRQFSVPPRVLRKIPIVSPETTPACARV